MSLALYRRYRPETFAEVIGQDHVTGPLQQALRNDKVNHAYLFLVRGNNCSGPGTYDSGSTAQAGPRDAGINASPNACRP